MLGFPRTLTLTQAAETQRFNQLAERVLRPPPWCARCDRTCQQNTLPRWLSTKQIEAHARGWRPEWCLQTPPPPRFEVGKCVLNTVDPDSPP